MSDLIKSITTTTISVNDVFEEAFEAAVEASPGNNDLILSYNPVSQTIGKSAFPADATTIAMEAKTEAATAQQTATSANVATQQLAASKIISVNNTDKTVTFTEQKYIRQFTVTSDYTPVIDFTNAQIGCGTVLNILQTNGAKVLWPANVKPKGYPLADQNGVVNTYYLICEDVDKYRFFRTVDSADFPVDDTNPTPVVVGTTIVTAGAIDQTTAVINYTVANNASGYKIELFVSADYSDTPTVVETNDTDLAETLTGLIDNTDYYIKVTPFAGSVLGIPGTLNIKTLAVNDVYTTILDKAFSNFDGAVVANAGLDHDADGVSVARFTQANSRLAYSYNGLNILPTDKFKVTIVGVRDPVFNPSPGMHFNINGKDYDVHVTPSISDVVIFTDVLGPNIGDNTINLLGKDGIYVFVRELKVEKLVTTSTTPTGPTYHRIAGIDNATINNQGDGPIRSQYPASDYTGMDIRGNGLTGQSVFNGIATIPGHPDSDFFVMLMGVNIPANSYRLTLFGCTNPTIRAKYNFKTFSATVVDGDTIILFTTDENNQFGLEYPDYTTNLVFSGALLEIQDSAQTTITLYEGSGADQFANMDERNVLYGNNTTISNGNQGVAIFARHDYNLAKYFQNTPINVGDHIRVTLNNYQDAGGAGGLYVQVNDDTQVVPYSPNPTNIILNFNITTATSGRAGFSAFYIQGVDGIYSFVNSVKIEKIN